MLKVRSIFRFIDNNILLLLTGFLLVFIPLYPKIPLADLIPGYIVRLRIEDLLIGGTAAIFGIQLLRRKVTLKTPLTLILLGYLVVGLLSSLSAIYITKTVPMSTIHIQKLFLNYFRRIEYISLFFIAFSAIKSKRDLKKLLFVLVATILFVGVYGLGQRFLYWPVYSTMNREFSKGVRLYLTEHARVQSTFGGHYDFAAFLVIALPLLIGLMSYVKSKKAKFGLGITYLISLWGMMMTASRSSFLALVFSLLVYFAVQLRRKGLIWVGTRASGVFMVIAIFFVSFGDLSERFMQILDGTAALEGLQNVIADTKKITSQPLVEPPKDGVSVDDISKIIVPSDTQPTPVSPVDLPADVYEDIPDQVIATKSAEGKEIVVVIPRVFSENAHLLGLSAAIRLDTLWPFAIRGFLRNPALGSGYSTLTKYTNDQFTEAESTDNDFLRTLGETGLLGFLTFYGSFIVACVYVAKKARRSDDELLKILAILLVSITAGLFVNAVYIDIFVSSKVIESYWMFIGLILAYASLAPASKHTAVLVSENTKLVATKKKKVTFKRSKR